MVSFATNQTTANMKAKFFYAPAIFSPLPKIYVLTPDKILYSETREFSIFHSESVTTDSYTQFNPKLHETDDHPILIEIGIKEAKEISLNTQFDWVSKYLLDKNVFKNTAVQA
jgi:hypothetical protein